MIILLKNAPSQFPKIGLCLGKEFSVFLPTYLDHHSIRTSAMLHRNKRFLIKCNLVEKKT